METPPAVVLGGLTNALSVVRSLGRARVEVHAVGSAHSPVRYSRYCRTFTVMPPDQLADRLPAWLRTEAPAGAVLIPCEDEALELLANRGADLAAAGLRPLPSNPDAAVALLDKGRTYEIARACDVGTPRTFTLETREDADRAAEEMSFPCALKPLHIHLFARHFHRKVIVVKSPEELRTAFDLTLRLGLSMLATEIVPGPEDTYWSYYAYVTDTGELELEFTKQKIRQYPVGFGGATYHVAHRCPDAVAAGRRFVRAAGVRGIACVEFKRDERDGELKIMECNARITAANELMRIAGLDLAMAAYRDAAGLEPVTQRGFRDGVRLWYPVQDMAAFASMRRSGDLSLLQWLLSLAHRQHLPVFSVTDPQPSLRAMMRLPGRLRTRLGRTAETTSRPDAALQ